jgi:hypothetical protein
LLIFRKLKIHDRAAPLIECGLKENNKPMILTEGSGHVSHNRFCAKDIASELLVCLKPLVWHLGPCVRLPRLTNRVGANAFGGAASQPLRGVKSLVRHDFLQGFS